MTATLAHPETWTPTDRPAFTWWVMVEREDTPSLLVGPYTSERFAVNAMHDAPLIEGECQESATDCYLVGPGDEIVDLMPSPVEIVDIATETDPSYYGLEDTRCGNCLHDYTLDEFLSSGFTHECPPEFPDSVCEGCGAEENARLVHGVIACPDCASGLPG